MGKVVYLATTHGCSACKCMQYILTELQEEHQNFELEVCNYTKLPEYIKTNVTLTDFPVTIFVKDDVIKYHFSGTMPHRKIREIMNGIDF